MNELESINSQLNKINNDRIRYQTLVEQANKTCKDIETKYNISNAEQLYALLSQAELEYQNELAKAQSYINETNQVLSQYQGVL